ncbi:ATPase [Aureococcus anophagefferens]|nr:ATPase [Aureococcus anophagefferens]
MARCLAIVAVGAACLRAAAQTAPIYTPPAQPEPDPVCRFKDDAYLDLSSYFWRRRQEDEEKDQQVGEKFQMRNTRGRERLDRSYCLVLAPTGDFARYARARYRERHESAFWRERHYRFQQNEGFVRDRGGNERRPQWEDDDMTHDRYYPSACFTSSDFWEEGLHDLASHRCCPWFTPLNKLRYTAATAFPRLYSWFKFCCVACCVWCETECCDKPQPTKRTQAAPADGAVELAAVVTQPGAGEEAKTGDGGDLAAAAHPDAGSATAAPKVVIVNLVAEKSARLLEAMKMAGLKEAVYWAAVLLDGSSASIWDISPAGQRVYALMPQLAYGLLVDFARVAPRASHPWSEYGTPKPFYFPLLPSYWLGTSRAPALVADAAFDDADDPARFEALDPGTHPPRCAAPKTFGEHKAVDGVSFGIRDSEIFCLLGHNGAGKTTTMAMISGLLPPDPAGATDGRDGLWLLHLRGRRHGLAAVPLGVCPQHDVLFPRLTLAEHVFFFSRLKGQSVANASREATSLLGVFHLGQRAAHLGAELSGGQKRKLSTSIALAGGSRFIILDEPTAGMDPSRARALDAPAVRARRAVAAADDAPHGRGGGAGRPRRHHVVGQDPHVRHGAVPQADVRQGLPALGDAQERAATADFGGFVSDIVAGATLQEESLVAAPDVDNPLVDGGDADAVTERTYALPASEEHRLAALFDAIDGNLDGLAITSTALEPTTLETVFMVVGEDDTVHNVLAAGAPDESIYVSLPSPRRRGGDGRPADVEPGPHLGGARCTALVLLPAIVSIMLAGLCAGGELATGKQPRYSTIPNLIVAVVGVSFIFVPGLAAEPLVSERANRVRNLLTISASTTAPTGSARCSRTRSSLVIACVYGGLAGFDMRYRMWKADHQDDYEAVWDYYCDVMTDEQDCWNIKTKQRGWMTRTAWLWVLLPIFGIALSTFAHMFTWNFGSSCPCTRGGARSPPVGALCMAFLRTGLRPFFMALGMLPRAQKILDTKNAPLWPAFWATMVVLLAQIVAFEAAAYLKDRMATRPLAYARSKFSKKRKLRLDEEVARSGTGRTPGDAKIAGKSVLCDFGEASAHLGVVNQHNSLWPSLSCYDHRAAAPRAARRSRCALVTDTLRRVELLGHAHKMAGRLSGGMKRKLCCAAALVGDPRIVLLDEPSAGLDPVSQRNLWNLVKATMAGRAVVLTTHSMVEADVLCDRIGIMVKGQLECLGTPRQLRTSTPGYELAVKLDDRACASPGAWTEAINRVTAFATATFAPEHAIALARAAKRAKFPTSKAPISVALAAADASLLTYEVSGASERGLLAKAFRAFDAAARADLGIAEFSVAQASMEKVFIRIVAKTAADEERRLSVLDQNALGRDVASMLQEEDEEDELEAELKAMTFRSARAAAASRTR